jgi:DNA-binding response OmpR family regulator
MKILIADDDPLSCRLLESTLTRQGFEVVVTRDGATAWSILSSRQAPPLAILDWIMPGHNGPEICRKVRALVDPKLIYLILLTANNRTNDISEGLQAGADDYIIKPFDKDELYARIQAGARIVELQQSLADRVQELEAALARVKLLHGLLPICCYCKKVHVDQNYWQQVEHYIARHSDAQFSHGICPDCYQNVVEPELQAVGILSPNRTLVLQKD